MKYSTVHTSVRDVATSKLASDLSSGSKKPEPDNSVPTSEIYSWASQLASESRKLDWVFHWYVWPDAVREIIRKLETTSGGIIGLVGFQGVGKSSALLAISSGRTLLQHEEHRDTPKSIDSPDAGVGLVNLVIGALFYVGIYLTLTPVLKAVSKQDIINLRTTIGKTRMVAAFTNPIFDYEDRLISAMGQG